MKPFWTTSKRAKAISVGLGTWVLFGAIQIQSQAILEVGNFSRGSFKRSASRLETVDFQKD
jgi:hypothetical protein